MRARVCLIIDGLVYLGNFVHRLSLGRRQAIHCTSVTCAPRAANEATSGVSLASWYSSSGSSW